MLVHERYTQAQVDAFCDALRLFKLGYSWGGPVSLVVPYELPSVRTRWPALEAFAAPRCRQEQVAVARLTADIRAAGSSKPGGKADEMEDDIPF